CQWIVLVSDSRRQFQSPAPLREGLSMLACKDQQELRFHFFAFVGWIAANEDVAGFQIGHILNTLRARRRATISLREKEVFQPSPFAVFILPIGRQTNALVLAEGRIGWSFGRVQDLSQRFFFSLGQRLWLVIRRNQFCVVFRRVLDCLGRRLKGLQDKRVN